MIPNPVNWFEIPTTNLERAKTFFETAFGLTLSLAENAPIRMAFFGPMRENSYGITGSLIEHENVKPSHHGTLVYFHTEDINALLAKITAAGGKTLLPRMSIGEFGFIAHFEDSEGNRLGLHSMQ